MYIKAALVGASGVGKTQIFRKLCTQQAFQLQHVPTSTPGFSALHQQSESGERIMVQVWDMPSTAKHLNQTRIASTNSSAKIHLPPITRSAPGEASSSNGAASQPTSVDQASLDSSLLPSEYMGLISTSNVVLLVCDLTSRQSLTYIDRFLSQIAIAPVPARTASSDLATADSSSISQKSHYPFACILVINKCEPANAPRQAFRSADVNALCTRHKCIQQILEFSAVLNINAAALKSEIFRLGTLAIRSASGLILNSKDLTEVDLTKTPASDPKSSQGVFSAVATAAVTAESQETTSSSLTVIDPHVWRRSQEVQSLRADRILRKAQNAVQEQVDSDMNQLVAEAETRARIEKAREKRSRVTSEAAEREAARQLAREALEARWGVDSAARRVSTFVKFDLESCGRFRKLFGSANVIPLSHIQVVMHRIGHPAWCTPLVVRRLVWATSSMSVTTANTKAGLGKDAAFATTSASARLGTQWVDNESRIFGRPTNAAGAIEHSEPSLSYPEFMWLLDAIFHGDIATHCELVWALLEPVKMETDEEEWFDENDPGIIPDDSALLEVEVLESTIPNDQSDAPAGIESSLPKSTQPAGAALQIQIPDEGGEETKQNQDVAISNEVTPQPEDSEAAVASSGTSATSKSLAKTHRRHVSDYIASHAMLPILAAARRQVVIAAGTAKFAGTKTRTPTRAPLALPPSGCTTAEHVERLFSAITPYLPAFQAALHTGIMHGEAGLTALELRKGLRPATKKLASEFLAAFAGPRAFTIRKVDFVRKVLETPGLLSLWAISP